MRQTAVVFAYHNVGFSGLAALLANEIDVKLLVTHQDDPGENIWFKRVAELAELNNIPVIFPKDPNTDEIVERISQEKPDWIFSFYYRYMLGQELLDIPARGALNLHGSLLPKYRGRTPINWAVLHGERECGASLHRMEIKPDAGALIDQQAVPILPNDTAFDVFQKVTGAAEIVLMRALPGLLAGQHQETPLELSAGSYFGGRKPEDGRVNWSAPAQQIHNLVRAVAPPYPGAFTDVAGHRLHILGSYFRDEEAADRNTRIYWSGLHCYADCADGKRLRITHLQIDQQDADLEVFTGCFGGKQLIVQ
jgi:methionyl-tRNA formyltransferase